MFIAETGGRAVPQPATPDRDRIHVKRSVDGSSSKVRDLGTIGEVIADPKTSRAERRALQNVLHAIARLRDDEPVGSPIAQALDGVEQVVLGVYASPAADHKRVLVPPRNPLAGAPGVTASNELFPLDVALHEVGHLIQEGTAGATIGSRGVRETRGMGGGGNFDAVSVAEGLADAFAAIELERWSTGSGYVTKDSTVQVVRDYDHPHAGGRVLSDLRMHASSIRHRDSDPHVEGGVAGELFHQVQLHSSWAQASITLRGVLSDPQFRASNQSWYDLRDALRRQGEEARGRNDVQLADAIDGAIASVGLA